VHLSSLHIYPIKSCGGLSLERASLDARGLAHDRRFMLVDDAGVFVTQREEPAMALFHCGFDGDDVMVSHDAMGAIHIPLHGDGERVEVRVWKDKVSAILCPEASAYFRRALDRSVRLVRLPEDATRVANPARAGAGHLVSFADGYPLLLTSKASLADLEARAGREFSMRRFRPNLVVSGLPAWAEDELTSFTVGDVAMRAVKPCERCAITTVDPLTGGRDEEPLRTLASFRKHDGKVRFGVNVVHDEPGELEVGQHIELG